MPWLSRYPLPARVAPPLMLPSSVTTQAERYVRSESELRSAIGEATARFAVDANGFPSALGGSIVVASSFTVKSTIVIPPKASLLTIRSIGGGVRLLPSTADQGTLFKVQGIFVTIRDLFVFYAATDGVPTAWFNTLVETEDLGLVDGLNVNPESCRVLLNTFYGDRLFVDGSAGGSDDALIADNWTSEANGTHAACVVLDSNQMICRDNRLSDGGGDAVTVSANGVDCSVAGNDCAGGDITSSASAGGNVLRGNRRTGTITRHVTDAEGLNT